jgi:hypothetical protein
LVLFSASAIVKEKAGDSMNATLLKALVALVPTGILFVGSVNCFVKEKARRRSYSFSEPDFS